MDISEFTNPLNQESDFNNLVKNGIEFLEMAISQLETKPKHSLINFYTAVEILLKAPLVQEHWTLVIADRDISLEKYKLGNFVSVSFVEACKRHKDILGKPIELSAIKAFDIIRQHRHRVVHFYHEGIFNPEEHKNIKAEQATAWFELQRFITVTWREIYKPFLQKFENMERVLTGTNNYASVKYKSIEPDIQEQIKAGKHFETCTKCGCNSFEVIEEVNNLISKACMVCFHNEVKLKINCPSCNDPNQFISPFEGFQCELCNYTITSQHGLYNLIDQNTDSYKDYFEAITPASCDDCEGYETVCEYEEHYLCVCCLTLYDTVYQCEYCNGHMTSEASDTYIFGCQNCEGMRGIIQWIKLYF
ncbi:hypothetical protein [Thorsellia anophelis]|uniref:HsdR n=1 Tax=Thorsellia anophelis DSM 18579 TaxID=1123402 RepID=A0A1I0FU70_9GAMM|nr:hypothetical protein [Thorsellia anophelis]SET62008.1 hypothetical protein SAMN02583745_02899 [Thorsellia anophelis DSM 18579]